MNANPPAPEPTPDHGPPTPVHPPEAAWFEPGGPQPTAARPDEPASYLLSRWVFLRLIGAIYLVAIVSWWVQMDGLIGRDGILPAEQFLSTLAERSDAARYWQVPTLCWLDPSDAFRHWLCGVGVALSVLVIVGVAAGPCLLALWAIYLSLCAVGGVFLQYQWDILLLEAGFLAAFFAPWRLLPCLSRERAPSMILLWLLRWLLFRLMFLSGVVKLASGDATWRALSALTYHYETQPLPTWIGWYAHQLPAWWHTVSTAIMFAVELAVPFLIFTGRLGRNVAAASFAALMLLIALTGNYCFFNLLTIALCVPLVDDDFWERFVPRAFITRVRWAATQQRAPRGRPWVHGALATVVLALSLSSMAAQLLGFDTLPRPAQLALQWASPFRSINSYGLFSVMTTTRPEIIVEGSDDGEVWQAYEFKWKPGELTRRPAFVAPHQPRLDWQMWFAALGDYRANPWFLNFLARLLTGAPQVLDLLAKNPFPAGPPRYVRAVLYEYHFTDLATRQTTGAWWRREAKGLYCPELSLRRRGQNAADSPEDGAPSSPAPAAP